jgi:signal transduction histidine kinase
MDPKASMFLPPNATLSEGELRVRLERAEKLLACHQTALGHELPNHLVAINGLLQFLTLEEETHLTAEGREYVRRLVAATQRVQTLVGRLADIGRLLRDSWRFERVALNEALREAAAESKKLCPQAIIGYDLCEPSPELLVARKALRQVLLELLRNAVAAAPAGRPPRIEIGTRTQPPPGGVEFWIGDDGRGLSPERQRRLFEPFPGSDLAAAGSGLGLFVVRLLVEIWGGTVRVESIHGQRTTVTVTTPVA